MRQVVVELVAHQAEQEALRQELGEIWVDHGLVFPETDRGMDPGAPGRPSQVTHRHAELVRAAELPKIVLHEMRHGAASMLHAAGLTMDEIALVLGHSTEDVTRAVYVHSIRGQLSAGAQHAADMVHGDN